MWPDSNSFIDWGEQNRNEDSGESSTGLPRRAVVMVFEVEAVELQLTLFLNSLGRKSKRTTEETDEASLTILVRPG